jgi:hypothetical protein
MFTDLRTAAFASTDSLMSKETSCKEAFRLRSTRFSQILLNEAFLLCSSAHVIKSLFSLITTHFEIRNCSDLSFFTVCRQHTNAVANKRAHRLSARSATRSSIPSKKALRFRVNWTQHLKAASLAQRFDRAPRSTDLFHKRRSFVVFVDHALRHCRPALSLRSCSRAHRSATFPKFALCKSASGSLRSTVPQLSVCVRMYRCVTTWGLKISKFLDTYDF